LQPHVRQLRNLTRRSELGYQKVVEGFLVGSGQEGPRKKNCGSGRGVEFVRAACFPRRDRIDIEVLVLQTP